MLAITKANTATNAASAINAINYTLHSRIFSNHNTVAHSRHIELPWNGTDKDFLRQKCNNLNSEL